jgi:hypothetical protein
MEIMFKMILVIKLVASDTYTEATLSDSERLRILKSNPDYEYCVEYCQLSIDYKRTLGAVLNSNHELVDIVPSKVGIVSSTFLQNDVCSIGMLPFAGTYKLSMNHPQAKLIYADILKSKDLKKKVSIFLKRSSTEIIAASLEE